MNAYEICLSGGASIPLANHHMLQAMIYNIITHNGDDISFFHDTGYKTENGRKFKLFCFSSLRGKKIIADRKIIFEDKIYLDVRSISDDFCTYFEKGLEGNSTVTLGEQELSIKTLRKVQSPVLKASVVVQMLSPITVYASTDSESYYFSPIENDFSIAVNNNFQNKYKAYYGYAPDGNIHLSSLQVLTKDKYVTHFKNTMITAWRGVYLLKGSPEHIQFLYYTGLGGKNSAGFGLWSPVEL
ncbi:MAG: CRISPR-associated endoribonuclease Cas6 [Fusobacteriaceae bacterium]|jgi:CRISPR-associated endoribonuclease Cas6|nr:CRISPR-associated endoribonuclease Cas6 [Fusobacteriaceae bacterium]